VSKRLLILLCAAALLTSACSQLPEGEVVAGEGTRFVPAVADFIDDVGLGNAVTVDADGVPYYSYWIFPAELAEGEIPAARPIGSPYIQTESTPDEPGDFGGAIGVGSVSTDGVFTRGAAAQVRDTPDGITVPYGPATVEALIGATRENTNGTDIAIDAAGGKHVVWTGPDGVWYAGGDDSFTADQVFDYEIPLRRAGPIGRPAVTADEDGNAWVAYTVNANGQRVEVATQTEQGWAKETVAEIPVCSGCPQPKGTEIGVTADGPMVAYVDTSTNEVKVAVPGDGGTWTSTVVASDVSGDGLDMAVDADGAAYLTFYDGQGGVKLAAQDGTAWTVTDVATSDAEFDPAAPPIEAPTTGVAVNDDGGLSVTYTDAGSVLLVSSTDGAAFEPVDISSNQQSDSSAVAVVPDGSATYLTWYGTVGQDLRIGIWGDVQDLQVAAPSPTPEPNAGPAPPSGCGDDPVVALDIEALAGNTFDVDCLVAASGEKFTVNYTNTDTTTAHNFDLMIEQGGEQIGATDLAVGPIDEPLDVEPLDVGSYFFQCDAHPTTMFGTLAVVKGAK
jgi:hypothetical protein